MNVRGWSIGRKSKTTADEAPVEVVSRTVESDGVSLELSFGEEFWTKLEGFIGERIGFLGARQRDDAISLLLQWGAPEDYKPASLTTVEKFAIMGDWSSLHWKLHDCFKDNQAIAMGLRIHWETNRSLKRRLAELKGAGAVPKNEWDGWDDDDLDSFYKKHVFAK